jgi:hypothetical protein
MTEIRDKIDRIVDEFGDGPLYLPDALEPAWLNKISDVEFDHDKQVAIATTD